MNKLDLISAVAAKTGITAKLAKEVLSTYQSIFLKSLRDDKEMVLFELGKIKIIQRNARPGVNPKTKQKITIPAKKVPKLAVSKKLQGFVEGSVKLEDFSF